MPFIGQSVLCTNVEDQTVYYGPWFPRQSDAATFFLEVMHLSANAQMQVIVQHKNEEDADSSATTVATFSTASSVGTYGQAATGLKELVRFKYVGTSAGTSDWMHFRMLPPMWQPN